MKLVKAIHMKNWSVEIFEMDRTGSYAIVGKNYKTFRSLERVVRQYDTASHIFDLIMAGMEGM
jgi:hypothetical protein